MTIASFFAYKHYQKIQWDKLETCKGVAFDFFPGPLEYKEYDKRSLSDVKGLLKDPSWWRYLGMHNNLLVTNISMYQQTTNPDVSFVYPTFLAGFLYIEKTTNEILNAI